MNAPERIWVWKFNPGWQGGYWREDKNAYKLETGGAEYVRADLLEAQAALIAEARRLLAYVAGDDEWDTETVTNSIDDQWVIEVRSLLTKLDNA